MIQLLLDNPLLLLFTIVAIGYPLGQIKIGQSRLGVAAVLFVGIGIGSLHPDLILPEIIYLFGLLIFIYTIGLSSGPGFFASFRRKGLRDNLFVVGLLLLAALLTIGATVWLQLPRTLAVGLFAGSLTNTPALASILEAVKTMVPQFGAFVTRLRRGDVEFLPHGDTVLEPGDRVRVVAKREQMQAISDFFGDSYRMLSEIDILTFSFGLCLGLLLGNIPIPLPGGVTFKLGLAGGPLIIALILGALGRTGPFVWNLPYSANLTLRQLGLILFLAGIGTRAGYVFVNTLSQGTGLLIFIVGSFITMFVALAMLWIGHRLLHIPFGLLIGMLAGLQTQPAVLGFALEQSNNELPNVGYATVFPIATITKILLAQLLLALLVNI